jgi:hypothetical protein
LNAITIVIKNLHGIVAMHVCDFSNRLAGRTGDLLEIKEILQRRISKLIKKVFIFSKIASKQQT